MSRQAYCEVEVRGIHKSYRVDGQPVKVLDGVDLCAPTGTFVTVLGPSGCGKTTLFSIITGLQQADAGDVLFDGQAVSQRLGRVGYMPQHDLLLPWRRLLDNVILGPEVHGEDLDQARQEARGLLPLFGLEGFEGSYPSGLSGGMRQRAALLRTILCRQQILLLDEPLGALDAITRYGMQEWLLEVWERFRYTILFITHDVEEAAFLSDVVYVLAPRPTRVAARVPVHLPRPRKREMTLSPEFAQLKMGLLETLQPQP